MHRRQQPMAVFIFIFLQFSTNSGKALVNIRMMQKGFDFNSWANKIGDNIQSKGLGFGYFDGGLRGIIATEKIDDGVIMSIPAGLALEVTNNRYQRVLF